MREPNSVSNTDDVIDSRDVLDRIEWLRDEIEAAEVPANEIGGPNDTMQAERDELAGLAALADQCEGYGDWEHGETLIRDSYFERYAMELADDIGAIPRGVSWPMTCIDWEQAANELRRDYMAVHFDGETYWMRA